MCVENAKCNLAHTSLFDYFFRPSLYTISISKSFSIKNVSFFFSLLVKIVNNNPRMLKDVIFVHFDCSLRFNILNKFPATSTSSKSYPRTCNHSSINNQKPLTFFSVLPAFRIILPCF